MSWVTREIRRIARSPWFLTVVPLLFAVCLTSAGCRRQTDPSLMPIRFAVVPGVSLSGHMAQDAEQGLERIRGELGVGAQTVPASDEVSRRETLRNLGENQVDLVFCFGGGFESMVFTEASAFPNTRFVLLPAETTASNVGGLAFRAQESSYLAGVVAGLLSPDQVAGVMVGKGGPWLRGVDEGFAAGVRVIHRRGEIVHAAAEPDGPWELAAQGVQAALYAADSADPAVLAAAHDAGVSLVVTDPDALAAEPDVVVASIHLDLAEAMVRIAQETLDGRFRGRVYSFDLGSGVVDLELSPLFVADAPPVVIETLEAARAQITAGIVELEGFGM